MSTQGSKRPLKGYVRDARRKKPALAVNLNEIPQEDADSVESISNNANAHVSQPSAGSLGDMAHPIDLLQTNVLPGVSFGIRSTPIDVDLLDEEVIISSPRDFPEAKIRKRSRIQSQQRGVICLDEEGEVHQARSGNATNPGRKLPERIGKSQCRDAPMKQKEVYIIVEQVKETVVEAPKPPVFSCAICMSDLVEATSTICGHIFCNKCIKTALTKCKKCPTCRKILKANNIHRVYLPTTN